MVSVRCFVVVISTCLAGLAGAADKPNVILCMADDLGWGDVGFNGNRVIRTPHLDQMAAAGLRFNRFYAGAPVCSPTRGSALTGRHPYRYGIISANKGHLPEKEQTLAELLRAQGYRTGHFGKWHVGTLTRTLKDSNRGGPQGAAHFSPPWQNGFDICFSTEAKVPTWDPLLRPRQNASRTWWDPVVDADDAEPYGTRYWSNGKIVPDELRGDDSRVIMDRAIPFIREAAEEQDPFFAIIWFHAPHLPVVAGPAYTSLYPGRSSYEQHYFGCITALDEQVGRLRQELRELGVADNTMLWFCSDNGPEGRAGKAPGSAGPLRGRKRSLFEGGIRVPGVLEWPARVQAGRETAIPAVTSDYLPTILAALGIERAADGTSVDGVSLLPLIDDRMSSRESPIGFESANQLALIGDRFKLVIPKANRQGKPDDDAETFLFDLTRDPSEKRDVGAEHPDVLKRMKQHARDWQRSCRASAASLEPAAAKNQR